MKYFVKAKLCPNCDDATQHTFKQVSDLQASGFCYRCKRTIFISPERKLDNVLSTLLKGKDVPAG
jgi:uncharacterized paraquat-inducible protein A